MITRKIGKILRGKATPLQLVLAGVLGAELGFVPSFAAAPGLVLALVLLLLILNANLFIAVAVAGVSKLVSLLLTPVSFEAGRLLLDGPTQPLFKWAINAPVLALFGLDSYVVTGGLLVAFIVGLALGIAVVALVNGFRRRMARLEEGSEKYKKYASKPGVRILAWAVLGKGHGKRTYADLLARKIGNPIRITGVIAAVVLVGALFFARSLLTDSFVTATLKRQLEWANGATVDIERVSLDFGTATVTIDGLAMADPGKLTHDIFRAERLQGDVAVGDLLRRRIAIDRLEVTNASSGMERATPGERIDRPDRPEPPTREGDKTIGDYIRDAQKWKDRLDQIARWIERLAPPKPDDTNEGETLRDRLERMVEQDGYRRVKASHLVVGAPAFLIREIEVNGMRVADFDDETIDIVIRNASTNPWLVDDAASVSLVSSGGRLDAALSLASVSRGGGESRVDFAFKRVATSWIAPQLVSKLGPDGQPPIKGGAIDVSIKGPFRVEPGIPLDVAMDLFLHDMIMTLPGVGEVDLGEDGITLPVNLAGALDAPRIRVEPDALGKALKDAGRDVLINELSDEVRDRVGGRAGELLDGGLRNILGNDRKKKDDDNGGG
ncbi:MAG: hypothetical protein ACF8SC_07110 [Phycisphaerales bacterium JB037]